MLFDKIDTMHKSLCNDCNNGNLEGVKFLVEHKVDTFGNHNEALYWAVNGGNLNVIKYLLDLGADPNDNRDFLACAAKNGHLDVVKYLIGLRIDPRYPNDTPVIYAAQHGHLEIVKYLEMYGADWHTENDIAFRFAAANGHLDVVQYLISIGANVNANHSDAIQSAVDNDRIEIVKYLIDCGSQINVEFKGRSPLDSAIKNGNLSITMLLIEHGAVVKSNMFFNACQNGHLSVVKYLHENTSNLKFDYNPKDSIREGATTPTLEYKKCIEVAAHNNQLNILQFLLNVENVKNKINLNSLLYEVSAHGHIKIVEFLIKLGANVNCEIGISIETPLIAAVKKNHVSIVKLLLGKGANPHFNHDHALYIANINSYDKIVDLLKNAMEKQTKMKSSICLEKSIEQTKSKSNKHVTFKL